MTISVKRQIARSGDGDRRGRRSRTDRYVVTGLRPNEIPINPFDNPIVDDDGHILPVPGFPNAFDPTVIADRVIPTELRDALGSIVDVPYSSNARFVTFDKPDIEEPSQYAKGLFNPRDTTVQIPVQKLITATVTNPGGQSVTNDAWQVTSFNVLETWQIAQVRVSVTNITNAHWRLFAAQTNKLHSIGGELLRFLQPIATPVGNRLEILYQWEFDPGTSNQFKYGGGQAARVKTPANAPVDPPPPTGLIRTPYHVLDTLERPYDPANPQPHFFIQLSQYAIDLNGWRALPGNPGAKLE